MTGTDGKTRPYLDKAIGAHYNGPGHKVSDMSVTIYLPIPPSFRLYNNKSFDNLTFMKASDRHYIVTRKELIKARCGLKKINNHTVLEKSCLTEGLHRRPIILGFILYILAIYI